MQFPFEAVVCNTRNAMDARLATQSKNRNMQCMYEKNTMPAIESILFDELWFSALFKCMHCMCYIAYDSLETNLYVRLMHFDSSSSVSTFGTCRPTSTGDRQVLGSWQMSSLWKSTIDAGPGYNYQSIRIKQMDAIVGERVRVTGGRADLLQAC